MTTSMEALRSDSKQSRALVGRAGEEANPHVGAHLLPC
jgi:hypothetical protein